MRMLTSAFAVALLTVLSVSANAAHITVFASVINSDQAGTMSEGLGSATMTFNSNTSEFTWLVAWQGLSGAPTIAHFHGPAAPGSTAGVQVTIDHLSNPSIGSAILDAGQTADLFAGLWYINIHTAMAPGGEIRGQVLPIQPQVVPLPAAVWLMLSAVGGLGLARRRKS